MYVVKFKLKAMDVAKKKSIAAAARKLGVKHLSSNNIIFDKHTSMKIILCLHKYSFSLTNSAYINLPPVYT